MAEPLDDDEDVGDLAGDMEGELLAAQRRYPYTETGSERDALSYYQEAKQIGAEMIREGLDGNTVEEMLERERDLLEGHQYTQTIPVENTGGSSDIYFQPAQFSVQD